MDNKQNLPSMNAFFIEDPDEPGSMAIPVVVINGEKVMLNNIRKERLDFFRPMVAAISKKIGAKAYFVEYETPSHIEEIEPVEDENITSIMMCNDKKPKASDILRQIVNMVDEALEERSVSRNGNRPNEEIVH